METATAQAILERCRAKQAGDPIIDWIYNRSSPPTADVRQLTGLQNTQAKAEAWKNIRNAALLGLGVGVGGRGLYGLAHMLGGASTQPKLRSGPASLELPYPIEPSLEDEDEGEKKKPTLRLKRSQDDESVLDQLGHYGKNLLAGNKATTPSAIPWEGAGMTIGALGGLGLGWKGVDMLLNKQREDARQAQLEKARKEFHSALLSQYDQPHSALPALDKAAAATTTMEKVGALLDQLYDQIHPVLEKAGQTPVVPPVTPEGPAPETAPRNNALGALLNAYGVYGIGSALLGGAFAYDVAKKRSRHAIINKALKQRQQQQFLRQPPELYAIPSPVVRHPPEP